MGFLCLMVVLAGAATASATLLLSGGIASPLFIPTPYHKHYGRHTFDFVANVSILKTAGCTEEEFKAPQFSPDTVVFLTYRGGATREFAGAKEES